MPSSGSPPSRLQPSKDGIDGPDTTPMQLPARTFRVFLSSTFEDLKAERDALHERVFPRLRALCLARGARFQAIDLRWGISEEAALDQQTLPICLAEIARCREVSPRPNFIALLGDRYGWRPLPAEIPEAEYEMIREHLTYGEEQQISAWYRLDANAVPPVYCLRPREREYSSPQSWEPVERTLRTTLARAAMPLPEGVRRNFGASATEQEIIAGALDRKLAPDAEAHVFAFLRQIEGLPADGSAEGFRDFDEAGKVDEEAEEHLARLKDHLRERLRGHVHEYAAKWVGNTDCESPISQQHVGPLCDDVYRALEEVILREIGQLGDRASHSLEVDAHARFGEDRARHFRGRAAIRGTISDYLRSSNRRPLGVCGPSGSGKSALLAKAAAEASIHHPDAAIVVRFIGATPASSNGVTLLASLGHEIGRAYRMEVASGESDYAELERVLLDRLALATADRPLLLFVDAIDQLEADDPARSLAWLPTELPEHARVIVSALPEGSGEALRARLGAERIAEVELMPPFEGEEILDLWLADARRSLTPPQRAAVLAGFRACPHPLYLKLAFEEARRWRSSGSVPELPPEIPGIISHLLDRLSDEANHGALLVSRSLALIAAAKHGLGEDELLDLLAGDDEYFEHLRETARHELPTSSTGEHHLPAVVWSRLYLDLEPYLTERSADGMALLAFYHRQLGEAVAERYLRDEEEVARHEDLAAYFEAKPIQHEDAGLLAPNLRKLSELPFQQVLARRWSEFENTLTDLEFLEAKCAAGLTPALLSDFAIGSERGRSSARLKEWQSFLKRYAHVLERYPDQFLQLSYNQARSGAVSELAEQRCPSQETGQVWLRRLNRPNLVQRGVFAAHEFRSAISGVFSDGEGERAVVFCENGTVTGTVSCLGHRRGRAPVPLAGQGQAGVAGSRVVSRAPVEPRGVSHESPNWRGELEPHASSADRRLPHGPARPTCSASIRRRTNHHDRCPREHNHRFAFCHVRDPRSRRGRGWGALYRSSNASPPLPCFCGWLYGRVGRRD